VQGSRLTRIAPKVVGQLKRRRATSRLIAATGSHRLSEPITNHCHPVKSRWSRWNVFFYNALREENGVSDLKMAVRFCVDFLNILLAKMLACIPEKPFSLNLWIGSIPSSFAAAWLVIAATLKSVTSLAGINYWL